MMKTGRLFAYAALWLSFLPPAFSAPRTDAIVLL